MKEKKKCYFCKIKHKANAKEEQITPITFTILAIHNVPEFSYMYLAVVTSKLCLPYCKNM